jgi:hypothetical protein
MMPTAAGQPVETVAFDAPVVQRAQNCEARDDFSISAMERRIKEAACSRSDCTIVIIRGPA